MSRIEILLFLPPQPNPPLLPQTLSWETALPWAPLLRRSRGVSCYLLHPSQQSDASFALTFPKCQAFCQSFTELGETNLLQMISPGNVQLPDERRALRKRTPGGSLEEERGVLWAGKQGSLCRRQEPCWNPLLFVLEGFNKERVKDSDPVSIFKGITTSPVTPPLKYFCHLFLFLLPCEHNSHAPLVTHSWVSSLHKVWIMCLII